MSAVSVFQTKAQIEFGSEVASGLSISTSRHGVRRSSLLHTVSHPPINCRIAAPTLLAICSCSLNLPQAHTHLLSVLACLPPSHNPLLKLPSSHFSSSNSLASCPTMAPHSVDDGACAADTLRGDCFWDTIRRDAQEMGNEQGGFLDPLDSDLLPGILESSILKWDSLEEALAAHLASKLSYDAAPADRWQRILYTAFTRGVSTRGDQVMDLIRKDLAAIKERDPACPSLGHAFLYFKGFHGLQVHRAANWLWHNGQQSLASVFQSRVSEIFGMDIHPAAQIGWGIMIDHATGIVIGETAKVGNGCTMLHGVTLGGTGKQHGDRHPKLGTNVLIGAGASILGNVKIGDGAKIGAAALVLNEIPPGATAVGCPAKVIGRAKEENPASALDQTFNLVEVFRERSKSLCPYRHLNAAKQGFLGPHEFADRLKEVFGLQMSRNEMLALFFKLDTDNDGRLSETEFENTIGTLRGLPSSDMDYDIQANLGEIRAGV